MELQFYKIHIVNTYCHIYSLMTCYNTIIIKKKPHTIFLCLGYNCYHRPNLADITVWQYMYILNIWWLTEVVFFNKLYMRLGVIFYILQSMISTLNITHNNIKDDIFDDDTIIEILKSMKRANSDLEPCKIMASQPNCTNPVVRT